jgi:hypothetical protein
MSDLASALKSNGYDYIDGPTRNHKILQLWRRRAFNAVDFAYDDVKHALNSPISLDIISDPALAVVSSSSQDFKFNIGLTFLKNVLEKIGAGKANLEVKITSGTKINISYEDSFSETVAVGQLNAFFKQADFTHLNENLHRDLNRDNFIIISGVIYAQNLKAKIESDLELTADLQAELLNVTDGKVSLQKVKESTLQLTADLGKNFPIALKYNRIKYGHGNFKDLPLLSDSKQWF